MHVLAFGHHHFALAPDLLDYAPQLTDAGRMGRLLHVHAQQVIAFMAEKLHEFLVEIHKAPHRVSQYNAYRIPLKQSAETGFSAFKFLPGLALLDGARESCFADDLFVDEIGGRIIVHQHHRL